MRTWLVAAALLLLPLVVYWPTISYDYGFRDDYAHLREVRERPGWITTLTSAHGRPIFGAVLEKSLQDIYTVPDLKTLRLAATVMFGLMGVLLWWQLRRSGWTEAEAAALGAAATLLPGVQVVVGWAITWPVALACITALAGFAFVERSFASHGLRRAAYVLAGCALYVVTGLNYQTSALFVVMPLAALLLMRRPEVRSDAKWVVAHLGLLFVSLVAALVVAEVSYTETVLSEAARMQLEPHPFIKFLWFLRNPLPNSIALFALRDSYATPLSFWFVVAAVVIVALIGLLYGAKNVYERWRWLFAALLLPFVAHSVSLAASSQAIGYRTLLPLSGLFLVLFVFGVRAAAARFKVPPPFGDFQGSRAAEIAVLGALVAVGAVLARHNSLTLLAEPQGKEWRLMQAAANRLQLARETSVYLLRPTIEYRSTERVYADEYGSLSSDAQWGAVEMFRAAVRQRFPSGLPEGTSYTLATSFSPPIMPYDLVVDLRELKNQGERASAEATASRR